MRGALEDFARQSPTAHPTMRALMFQPPSWLIGVAVVFSTACVPYMQRHSWRDPRLSALVARVSAPEGIPSEENCEHASVFGRVAMLFPAELGVSARVVLDDGEYPASSHRAICVLTPEAERRLPELQPFDWVEVHGCPMRGSLPGYVLLVNCYIVDSQPTVDRR